MLDLTLYVQRTVAVTEHSRSPADDLPGGDPLGTPILVALNRRSLGPHLLRMLLRKVTKPKREYSRSERNNVPH